MITSKILELQESDGCWNVLKEGDKYYPDLNYYVPNYKSTLWTLVLLADLKTAADNQRLIRPLKTITEHFWDNEHGIFTIGKSHFPIPCLNGNMLYLLSYFKYHDDSYIQRVVDFFSKYQRFDDGDFKTPKEYPYFRNRSCYGKHTCYWGVVKLLKGLSFIPKDKRSQKAQELIKKCIDFILLHEVCFSSHNKSEFLNKYMSKLTFPNMYKSDFLEVLWLLRREEVNSKYIDRALNLLISKKKPDATWELERAIKDLIVPVTKRKYGNTLVTRRANEVVDYYGV